MMAGFGHSGHGQVHSWVQPGSTPPPLRADSCLMPICPWCILRAVHGDEQSAIRQADQARAQIASGPSTGHGHYIVEHSLKWCKELCRRGAEPSEPPVSQWDQQMAAWNQSAWMFMHGGCQSAAAAWLNAGASASTASSSSWRPHIPAPCIPPQRFARGSAAPMPSTHPTGPAPLPPPPPPAAPGPPGLTFQVWGGKQTKWINYEEHIQQQLRQLWVNGGGSVDVEIQGKPYTIHLTGAEDMRQDRRDTDQPPRKVRIMELEGS